MVIHSNVTLTRWGGGEKKNTTCGMLEQSENVTAAHSTLRFFGDYQSNSSLSGPFVMIKMFPDSGD